MKRLLVLALALAACNSNTTPVATGEFAAPSGLAVTSGGDRDLLFIANEGRDSLRALQICTSDGGTFGLPDGGTAADTCPDAENLQFVPAPIRVFPATVETGERPRRLAGVRLTRPDGSATGVVLAVGDDDQLRVVDARNLLEAAHHTVADGGSIAKVLTLQLDSPGVDVVAEALLNPAYLEVGAAAGSTATAFVATIAQGATKAELLELQVGVDAQGAAMLPVVVGQCTLDPVVPRKLAVVPGGGDRVYVADGAGDGVVSILKAGIPAPSATPAPCAAVRIAAGGRSARSVSVSPPWVEAVALAAPADAGTTPTPHPAGELVMMVLEPRTSTPGGTELDPGGILIARTADSQVVPVPPASVFDTTAGLQPMEPISPPGLPREVTFLRSNPTDPNCPNASCTPVYTGANAVTPTARFGLVAAATSTDGSGYFIDVLKRRLVNTSYSPGSTQSPSLPPSANLETGATGQVPPTFAFSDPTADHPNVGWATAGVTRATAWRVIWHAPFPGLETRSGMLKASGTGTLLLNLGTLDLAPWVSDPALQLAPGDTVSFTTYVVPAGAPASCSNLVANESSSRFELTILSLPAPGTLELAPLQPTATVRAFDFSACPTGLGVVATVRAAGANPWLVYGGTTARGRARAGVQFVAHDRRFDYPLDSASPAPLATDNVAVAFLLGGGDPLQIGSAFSFSVLSSGLVPQSFRDSLSGSLPQGFATTVLGYSSPRYPQLVFTAVTGANAVVQADTAALTSDPVFGVVSYK